MKLALLLPGYLDSPDYLHMVTFEKRLNELKYTTERLDPCHLWETGDVNHYSLTNYLHQIRDRIDHYKNQEPDETVLIGHSLGGLTAILAGNLFPEVTRVIALCPPASIERLAEKWEGKPSRTSKRDLPEDGSRYREFDIPITFVEDARKYSAIEAVHAMNKPLMIFIGMQDTSVAPEETETLVSRAINPHVIRQLNVGHNFRNLQEECGLVIRHIEDFLLNSNLERETGVNTRELVR